MVSAVGWGYTLLDGKRHAGLKRQFVVAFIVLLLMNLLLWPAIGFPGLAPM